jgi:SAM-dependent methyltransferase
MKLCLACRTSFGRQGWICPACGFAPTFKNGYPLFAPALAFVNDGMPDTHAALDKIQQDHFWFAARNRLIVGLVRRFAGNAVRVLEIGCGTGFVLRALCDALPAANVSGAETYLSGLVHASRRLEGKADFLQMDARAMPFEAEFDLIGAFDVLEHIDDDRQAMSEIYRVLQPGGTVLLTVPQHQWLWSAADEFSMHKRRYRSGELAQKMRGAGLRVLMTNSFVVTLLPAMILSRRSNLQIYDPTRELCIPPWLNALFKRCLDLECMAIRHDMRFPIGGTQIAVGRK